MKKLITFKDYLGHEFMDQYMGVDDDCDEKFQEWLADLDAEEWLKHGKNFEQVLIQKVEMRVTSEIDNLTKHRNGGHTLREIADYYDAVIRREKELFKQQ